ncbi:MAG: chorismate synthase [Planctomycetota bacterium]|jgi:chorismate synthase
MTDLTYQTAGESHGPAVTTLVRGLPAGVPVDLAFIDGELRRRQGGYGRGGRQKIETDAARMLAGVRHGLTTGAPIVMQVVNRDDRLEDDERTPPVHRPRPGHADLPGSLKWLTTDCRETLERASARETAGRTAAGALARGLLRAVGIEVFGFVRSLLDVETDAVPAYANLADLCAARNASVVYCPDAAASAAMVERIRAAKVDKDTVGGVAEVHVFRCPPGLGSCTEPTTRLDGRIAGAVMSIQAFKAVEIGLGVECGRRTGSRVHDPIEFDAQQRSDPCLGFVRPTNNAGGIEGGMTNGMPIVVRGTMKPISTLLRGLPSVDLNTREPEHSAYERSDVCALSAASVVMENVVAFEVARVVCEKFAGDTLQELEANYATWLAAARSLPRGPVGAGGSDEDQSEA